MEIKPIREKWKGTMTNRERFNNQMHYKPFDRTVNMEFGYWDENFKEWSGFVENNIINNWQADQFFNFDRLRQVGGNTWIHPGFEEIIISETDDKKVIRNHVGLIAEVPKDGHSTIPHCIKSSINTPDDWKKVKKERFDINHPDRKVDIEKIKTWATPDRDYPLGVDCGSMIGRIRDLLTVEGLAYATYDYPEMVEDMVETACQLVENFLDQVLGEFDFDYASGWEDIAFKNGPLISLDFFHKVVVPRYKRLGDKIHKHGITLWFTDCDGDVRPLIPGFLEGGINCLFPFEVNSGGHPAELLKEETFGLK